MLNFLHRRGWSWYAAKTPKWLIWYYKRLTWRIKTKSKIVYLTFDDGPIPIVTDFVLNILKDANIKAHFFCIGKNVVENPAIYKRILDEGHIVGNHTFNHLNGWKTNADEYLQNIIEANKVINSNFFRPPYGRITKRQIKLITKNNSSFATHHWPLTIIMWDVLSGDFDTKIDGEKCYQNIIKNVQPGSIIVFHDSEKAFPRMKDALPKTINWLKANNYHFSLLQ
jgi:peptidoglycan/xylan/chitin deacetylase (PgdA/CDA1 family)